MGFSFGNFDNICTEAALIPCSLLGEYGIEPICYGTPGNPLPEQSPLKP